MYLVVASINITLTAGELLAPMGPVRRRGGYADQLSVLRGERGMIGKLDAMSRGPEIPLGRIAAISHAAGGGRPLGRALAPGGTLDRVLSDGGPLARVLDTVLAEGGLVDRLLAERGLVEKLVADGGTLDQLVALGPILEQVHPRLLELVEVLPQLHESVDVLGQTVGPLSDLANRIPGRRKSPAESAR